MTHLNASDWPVVFISSAEWRVIGYDTQHCKTVGQISPNINYIIILTWCNVLTPFLIIIDAENIKIKLWKR